MPPKKAAPKKKGFPALADEGAFTAEEVDVRVIWIRWDSLKESPVLNLGNVDKWTALAWLSLAVNLLEMVSEEITMEGETL